MEIKMTKHQQGTSFENVLEALGVPGKFQITQTILILTSKLVVTFSLMSFVFMGYEPPHVCNSVNETNILENHGLANDSSAWIGYDSCHIKIYTNKSNKATEMAKMACPNGRNFSKFKHVSYLSEWDLVCETRGQAELVETVAMVGSMGSGLMSTTISDRFGRKPLLVTCSLMLCVIEIIAVFAPSISVVMVFKLFSGFFAQGVVCTYFVMEIELVVPRQRQTQGVVYVNTWAGHILVLAIIAYALQNQSWRYLQGTIAAFGVLCLLLPYFLTESPRWLALNNHKEKVMKILKYACRLNGTKFENVKTKLEEYWIDSNRNKIDVINSNNDDAKEEVVESMEKVRTVRSEASLLTLIRNKRLLRMTFLTWFIWTSHNLTYFGLYMTSTDITGNRFLNFSLMTLVEIPGNFLILIMMEKMKRKTVLMIFLALSAVLLMASSVLLTFGEDSSSSNVLSTILFISGKFSISASFNVLYIITPELYPTNLRSIGNGINTSSSLGSMLAPFSRPLFSIAKWAPGLIFTIVCVISLIMVTGLPETKNRNLPNRVKDDDDDIQKESQNRKNLDDEFSEYECMKSAV